MPTIRLTKGERALLTEIVELDQQGPVVVHENMSRAERELVFELTVKGVVEATSRVHTFRGGTRYWTVAPTEKGVRVASKPANADASIYISEAVELEAA